MAADSMLARLERAERAAIAAGDAETAVQRRGERVLMEQQVIELRALKARFERTVARLPGPTPSKHGPKQMVTALEIARKRQELVEQDLPHGERPIAKALGVSRDAVRYALGKDKRKA